MSFQPPAEKEAERQLIRNFAEETKSEVVFLQRDNDNGKADGIIEYNGKEIKVEVRRKGYKNHRGETCNFIDGWKTWWLVNSPWIYLNELTVNNYTQEPFIFIVEINGFPPRFCIINTSMVTELLRQPHKKIRSTNSSNWQSVKSVPLDWFEEYDRFEECYNKEFNLLV